MDVGQQSHGRLRDLAYLCRPHQWVKNLFVLAPLLFSKSLLKPNLALDALLAFASFCLISSSIYIINDLIDREADRQHPRKRNRPLASGRVKPATAITICLLLIGVAIVGAALLLPTAFLVFVCLYWANSMLYCVWLKRLIIVDVLMIAQGFVLRVLGGCAAISIEPSSWVIVCAFFLALVLGFGKRRTEIANLGAQKSYRSTLADYDIPKVDMLLAIATAVCLVAYTLYTVAPETVKLHNTNKLIYTIPLVAYGLFRYLFKVQEGKGDGPAEILVSDPVFMVIGVLWGTVAFLVIYFARPKPAESLQTALSQILALL
jgi:4-hydroxybenzoate polyprenyltransferase